LRRWVRYSDSVRSVVYPVAQLEPQTSAVVIAQVDYDGKPAAPLGSSLETEQRPAGGQASGGWQPLNGGEEILRTIGELRRTGKLGPVQKLPRGSKEEIMALKQPAALIAHTHGFFLPREPGPKGNDGALTAGIVLYGANRSADHPGLDGLLTAKEAMLLNLDGTQLVALLGCETGLGAEAGEGVQGLQHALIVAGARSTLLTLWNVGDLSSARFLEELLTRASPVSHRTLEEALMETKLAFLRGQIRETSNADTGRWKHPYFWAAATLAGQDGILDLAVPHGPTRPRE